jgi:putative hydrolase of the HAD superfamily
VITDGLPAVQERKVRALGLESIPEKIIYSWEYGAERGKPHPLSFSLMLESFRTDPQSALFVGDNPEKDGRGAHGVGMQYAQIRHAPLPAVSPDEAGYGRSEFVIHSLFQLPQILQQIG